jgi:cytochrome c-type biogenesis protein CcmH/NrfG
MFLAQNRRSEAAADFSRALKINPSNSDAAKQLQGISGVR